MRPEPPRLVVADRALERARIALADSALLRLFRRVVERLELDDDLETEIESSEDDDGPLAAILRKIKANKLPAIGVGLTVVVGLLNSREVIRRTPLEVLRGE